jgi:hypothetical protein
METLIVVGNVEKLGELLDCGPLTVARSGRLQLSDGRRHLDTTKVPKVNVIFFLLL